MPAFFVAINRPLSSSQEVLVNAPKKPTQIAVEAEPATVASEDDGKKGKQAKQDRYSTVPEVLDVVGTSLLESAVDVAGSVAGAAVEGVGTFAAGAVEAVGTALGGLIDL